MKTLLNRILLTGVTALIAFTIPQALDGQTARVNPARTSDMTNQDWTLWRVGVLTGEEADKAYASKNYANAAALYEKAISHLQALQKSKPHWNRKGVLDRIAFMEKRMASSKRLAAKAESSGEAKTSMQEAAQLAETVSELSALKLTLENVQKQNARYKASLARAEQTAQQVNGLLAEKAEMEKKYSLLLIQYNDLKTRPAENEADQALKAVLESEKQQTDALRAELKKTRDEAAVQKLNTEKLQRENQELEKAAEILRQKINSVERLEKEILSLQQQIRDKNTLILNQEKKAKEDLLRANSELAKKSRQADEAHEELNKLRSKMDLGEAARMLEREVATLRAENAVLVKDLATRENELKEVRSKTEQGAVTTEQTKALAANLTEQNRQLSGELDKAGKKLKALADENKKLVADLAKASHEAARLQKERNEFAASLTQKSSDSNTQMQAAKAKADEQIKALETANKKLETARADLEQKNKEAESRIATLSADLKKNSDALNAKNAEIKKTTDADVKLKAAEDAKEQLEKIVRKQNAELLTLTENNEKLTKELDAANKMQMQLEKGSAQAAETLRDTIATLETEKVMLIADNANYKKRLDLKNAQLTEVGNAFEKIPAMQKQLKKQEADALAAKKAFDAEKQKSAEMIKKLTADLQKADDEAKKLSAKVNDSEKNLADLKDKHNKEISALNANLQKASDEAKKMAADVQKANDEAKKMAAKAADSEKTLAEQKRQYDEKIRKMAAGGDQKVQKEIQRLTANVADAEKTLADMKKKNDELAKQIDTLVMEKASLEKKLTEKPAVQTAAAEPKQTVPAQDAQLKDLMEQQTALKKSLDAAETKLAEREKELNSLRQDLKNTEETMSRLAKSSQGVNPEELTKLREVNTKLNETIKSMNAERAKLTEANIKLEKDLRAKQVQLENMRTENAADIKGKKLQADLEAKEKELKKVSQERQAAQDSVDKLTKEKELLQKRNHDLSKNLDDANQKTVALQGEVRKWSEGTDAVVKEKLAEKDKALDQVMNEHRNLVSEIERLRTELSNERAETSAAKRQLAEAKTAQAALKKQLKALNPKEDDGMVLYTTSVDPLPQADTQKKAPAVEKQAAPKLTAEQKKQYDDAMAEAKKFEAEKDPDQALWKYLQAADANQNAWEPHMAIAKIYLDSGKKEPAQKEYLKAIKNGAPRDAALDKALTTEVK